MTILTNISSIKSLISIYEQKHHRPTNSVTLLAVSKKQSAAKIREAYTSGQHAFGENYLQEALEKMDALADLDIEWHFIGPIQSNKTRKIAAHFSWVHSVDSFKIARRLSDQRSSSLPPLNICLEVNISGEASKSGIAPSAVSDLAAACRELPMIKLRGLMTIPAPAPTFAAARQSFHVMQTLLQKLNTNGFQLDTLSMGMSDDYEAAIAEGATLVRIGTGIFGGRS